MTVIIIILRGEFNFYDNAKNTAYHYEFEYCYI